MAVHADPRVKVYSAVDRISKRFHFAPLEDGPTSGKLLHKNLVLMTLTYLLDRNHLLVGEPGWGKTTFAKVVAAVLSGLPYNLYDSIEIRGHPQLYVEKIVGRPHYGNLARGEESVVWQGTFGADAIIGDELNRLALDSQDVILQGIDTGVWTYLNQVLFEGKKPGFFTMNEKDGDRENGLLPALRDRIDVVTEEQFNTAMDAFAFDDAKRAVQKELCDTDFTQRALQALARNYGEYKKALSGDRPIKGGISREEKARIQEEIMQSELDNDGTLFLQAFMAEINFSQQFGTKRAADPRSPDTHDMNYAGVNVRHSFSPRSSMAAMAYAKALAWFLKESPTLDHVKFVLPYLFAHKAGFHEDYVNVHAGVPRVDSLSIHLARSLVADVHGRYTRSIQPMKNLIADIQAGRLAKTDPILNKPHDHPLMIDLVKQYKLSDRRAIYGTEED